MAAPQHQGAHVLVTGAAGGIGAAVTAGFLARGATVTAVDTSYAVGESTDSAAGEGRLRTVHLDVTDPEAVAAVVAEARESAGPVTALVNAAGVLAAGPGEATADADWDRMFCVNAYSVFVLCRELAPAMARDGGGSVVTVGSNAGSVPRANMAAYAASKAAASSVTRSFGLEFGRHGVRCNVVCPGTTRTPMIAGLGEEADLVAGVPADYKAGIPLGRLADPEDIASVVLFLSGDDARHVTLQEVVVDGGASQR